MKPIAYKFSIKVMVVVLFSMALSACGFHLRGNYLVPEEISKLSFTSFDKYSQLTRNVEAQLRLNDIEVVPPSPTVPNLHLISESVSESTLSLYQNSTAAEKALTYNTSFRITIPELGTKTYSNTVTRNYLDNPSTALAKSVEKDMIEDEMRIQAASLIMRQMARVKNQIEEGNMQFDGDENQNTDNSNPMTPLINNEDLTSPQTNTISE
ncbi:LPS assembly lipoprotein LptE [Vibrio sp. kj40-1]|uniref:LPS-assembly lipoprotein LptE n=2 Tax=Vibrio algarum TaxID=3020714 RepID=A0ABT4YPA9_9VIBR|nr:LPS assembly lipoprotein LptE [Vibrio sp. KJ40-1]MDB1123225.1 LPS assembly lipoprotein LptE [Vibrio sp. KJ40-1]